MGAGQWIMLLFAAIALAIAVGLFVWRSRMGGEMALMAATETSKAADIAGKAAGTLVELKGRLRADAPLTSEFAKVPAIWYRALTEREVERISHNSKGERERSTSYETVTDVKRSAPGVVLDDGSGRVAVSLDGAKIEAKQVHQRRETGDLSLGSAVGGLLVGLTSGQRTLAHRYTEWVLEPDTDIYVLGTANAGMVGQATGGKKQPFIVSIKSEEQRAKSLSWSRLWSLIGAVVAAIVAIGLIAGAFSSLGS